MAFSLEITNVFTYRADYYGNPNEGDDATYIDPATNEAMILDGMSGMGGIGSEDIPKILATQTLERVNLCTALLHTAGQGKSAGTAVHLPKKVKRKKLAKIQTSWLGDTEGYLWNGKLIKLTSPEHTLFGTLNYYYPNTFSEELINKINTERDLHELTDETRRLLVQAIQEDDARYEGEPSKLSTLSKIANYIRLERIGMRASLKNPLDVYTDKQKKGLIIRMESSVKVKDGNRCLLTSDGLRKMITLAQIEEAMLEETAILTGEKLVTLLEQRDSREDDTGFVLFDIVIKEIDSKGKRRYERKRRRRTTIRKSKRKQ